MIILSGKSNASKDTVLKELQNKYGFEKIVTCTTRPMRPNETNGKDYHFLSDEEFQAKLDSGYFAEVKSFDMVQGQVWYGSPKSCYTNPKENQAIILTPDGISQIKKTISPEQFRKLNIIYLDCTSETRLRRAIRRGDDIEEILRREKADEVDFDNFIDDHHPIAIPVDDIYTADIIAYTILKNGLNWPLSMDVNLKHIPTTTINEKDDN